MDDRFSHPTRRAFSGFAASALASLLGGGLLLGSDTARAEAPTARAPAKHCIVLWMNGGPSHIDTLDPKEGKVAGPGRSRATRVRDVRISEHLPMLAEQMDKVALVRGVTSKEGNHERAQELGHTGHTPNPTVQAPSLGAWVTKKRPAPGLDIPAFVSLGGPSAGGGFFGNTFDPFVAQVPGALPDDLEPVRSVGARRDAARVALLGELDASFATRTGAPEARARRELFLRARTMMGSRAVQAFDVSSEPESVKAAYGDTDFGRGCLAARRLIEVGVPFVEVALDRWDTHEDNFGRTKKLMGALDPAMASLLSELAARELLSRTVVLLMGEFGRSPRINGDEGRDHHPAAFSVAMAGGGIRGGVVHGETDAEGAAVVRDPVKVADVLATAASLLGVDPTLVEDSPSGRPIGVTQNGRRIDAIVGS